MFSSTSFGEWTKVSEGGERGVNLGNEYYVDIEAIRKVEGYIYYWELANYLEPGKGGELSSKSYIKVDCKIFRSKLLSISFHKNPMGRGTGNNADLIKFPKFTKWKYPTPGSVGYIILKSVCNR